MNPEESYGAVAAEMYVPGEAGYQAPDEVLKGLEPEIVKAAESYASLNHYPWPPIASGYMFIVSLGAN